MFNTWGTYLNVETLGHTTVPSGKMSIEERRAFKETQYSQPSNLVSNFCERQRKTPHPGRINTLAL